VHTYPHELSGGMRQRAMIAMALACEPKIVIADEMTTALDVVTQVQILKLFQELQSRMNLSVIAISHELPILGQICENIMIMYACKMVEKGSMPPKGWRNSNPDDVPTAADIKALCRWSSTQNP